MSHTNSTENYGLPQWIGSDKPTFLGDFNTAFGKIDEVMKDNEDAATAAVNTANTAANAASTASTNATTALNTANSAATDAANAVTTAGTADTKATQALAAASTAETAAAANTITNLAPAYDATLTYAVGDLVTYVDAQGSGKLYKCIVAIGTPEEFNINKWDDITTSEVYGTKVSSISVTSSSDTFKTIIEKLFDNFSDFYKVVKVTRLQTNGSLVIYNPSLSTPTGIEMDTIFQINADGARLIGFSYFNGIAYYPRIQVKTSDNTNNYADFSDTSISDGETWSVYFEI